MSKINKNKTCINCGKPLIGWQNKFCCRSCSASYNNRLRGPMKEEVKEKIKNTLLEKYPQKPKNVKRKVQYNSPKETGICICCGKEFRLNPKNRNRKTCSNECLVVLRDKLAKKKHNEQFQYYLDHQDEFCNPNYIPKQFKPEKIEEQGGICSICGMKPEWNGKPLVFIMDHIDGDASNNRWENLRCICHNCDSQLDTYKSKNKNSKRTNYLREKVRRELLNNK